MFCYIRKTLIQYGRVDSKAACRCIKTQPCLDSTSKSSDQQSYTVSYLTTTCGLPLKKAISSSKWFSIGDNQRADSVLRLLRSHGFTESDIATLITNRPRLLFAEKSLKPKLEFFESLGIVGANLSKIVRRQIHLLDSSLKNQIVPFVDLLKGFLGTDENLALALMRLKRFSKLSFKKFMLSNISNLRANGVPEDKIKRLIMLCPSSLMLRTDLFEKLVNEVKEMDIQPTSRPFIMAILCRTTISNEKWEKKKELLFRWGWSEMEFNSAFRQQSMMMLCSERKMEIVMDFLVNKVGLKPSDVASYPNAFLLSLERRLMPRWLFLKALRSKGLIRKDFDLLCALTVNKKCFERYFVVDYSEDAPDVIKAYQDRTASSGIKGSEMG